MLRRQFPALNFTDTVEEDIQRPAGSQAWIELSQAASRGIARIDEDFLAGCQSLLVHGFEARDLHEHFAADFEQFWRSVPAQTQRHGFDGEHIVRDVFAPHAIATCGGLHQLAGLIPEAHREAVELRFRGVLHRLDIIKAFADAAIEIDQVLVAECILQRQHRRGMHDLAQLTDGCGTDALCG